eukprot:4393327-Pyramimonas_sp.AAC.1
MAELRLQDLTENGWDELGGVLIKADTARCLVPVLVALPKKYNFDDPRNPLHIIIAGFIVATDDVYNALCGAS